ncbi:MAG: ABC transporter ATP-binding protein [Phycisphaerales bacterium JB039]
MIRCEDVHKSFMQGGRRVEALRGATLATPGPGFYAIMGQSGSGKTTLLHLLAAMDRADSGLIEVDGIDVGSLDERAATLFRRKRIGVVFQQYNLIPTLSARENVELPGMLGGERRPWLRQRSDALLERLGMTERAGHRPEALSGGEQQRIAIARALLYAPPVLLADEPTGALDSATGERLWNLLSDLARERDMLVLMVTHEPAAAAHCEKAFVLRDGQFTGTIDTEGLDAAGVASRYQQCIRAA